MTTATAVLTRAEDAYLHLATFERGDVVDVGGRNWFQPGTVLRAQRGGGTLEDAFLLVSGCGIVTSVRVRDLLSGKFTVTSRAGAKAGNVRYFDEAGYAAQNPEGGQSAPEPGQRCPDGCDATLRTTEAASAPGWVTCPSCGGVWDGGQ